MKEASKNVIGTVAHRQTQEPLAGHSVLLFSAEDLDQRSHIGKADVADDGTFEIAYRRAEPVEEIVAKLPRGGPDFVLRVYDTHGELIHETPPLKGAARFRKHELKIGRPLDVLPTERDVRAIVTSVREALNGVRSVLGSDEPLTFARLRTFVRDGGASVAEGVVGRFVAYATLFRPDVAAYLSQQDPAAWQSASAADFDKVLELVGLRGRDAKVESMKFAAFRNRPTPFRLKWSLRWLGDCRCLPRSGYGRPTCSPSLTRAKLSLLARR